MSIKVKKELLDIKSKLEYLYKNLNNQSKSISDREVNWELMDLNIKQFKSNNQQKVILNIGGEKYTTTISTLLSDNTSIFNEILTSEIDLSDEIYIERNGILFKYILNYLRNQSFDPRQYRRSLLLEIMEEADFYNIESLFNVINNIIKDIEIISFEHNGDYIFKGQLAGTQNIKDIKTTDPNTGICTNTQGRIVFDLEFPAEFNEIHVQGYGADIKLWNPGNGAGAKIYSSLDKDKWEYIGSISHSFASKIYVLNLKKKVYGKYIKIEHTSYIGLSYFFLKRCEILS